MSRSNGFALLALLSIPLGGADIALAKSTGVYQTHFHTDTFESLNTGIPISDLDSLQGAYSITTTYEVGDIRGLRYSLKDEVETHCNDGANGNCQSTTYLSLYVKNVPVTIKKELVSEETGQVLSRVRGRFLSTLRGRSAYSSFGAPPALPTTLRFLANVSAEDAKKLDTLVLKLGDYYLIDLLGGTANNRLISNGYVSEQGKFVNLKYDTSSKGILSSSGVIFGQESPDDYLTLTSARPLADDTGNSFVLGDYPEFATRLFDDSISIPNVFLGSSN
jgi:hypothetical protein